MFSSAAAVGSVAAYAGVGGVVSLLAHFTPLYLGAVIPLVLASFSRLLVWRWTIGIVSAVAFIMSGLLVLREVTRDAGPSVASSARDQIKIIQFNALRSNQDVGRIAEWLIAQRPDIVTISEARVDLRDALAKRAGWRAAGGHGSLMIFTARPYLKMDRPRLNQTHTPSFVNATYGVPSGPIEVLTTHFNRRRGYTVRPQREALERIVEKLPQQRMIMTGDFNATPWSGEIRALDRASILTRRTGATASWPAQVFGVRWPLPFLAIDHVYAGPEWATVRVERGPWLGSDHYPIIVTLAPTKP